MFSERLNSKVPLTTNLTDGIRERIALLNESEAFDFTLAENALIVSHPVNVCRPSSDWHRFSPRMPITFAMLRRRHLFFDEMSMYKSHPVNFLLECYAKYQDVSVSSNNHGIYDCTTRCVSDSLLSCHTLYTCLPSFALSS